MCAKRFYTLSLGYEKLQNSDTYGLLLSWRLIDSYKGTDSNLSRSPILLILQCIISTLLTFLGEICRTRLSQTTEVAIACAATDGHNTVPNKLCRSFEFGPYV